MGTSDRSLEIPAAQIRLAREPPFELGGLRIEPKLRLVAHRDGREEALEPRVMQVLVALARADGGIVTRDELLNACWNGVVVGEDAIDRVIGKIRRAAERLGGFRLETVTKVGYRLVATSGRPAAALAATALPIVCVLPFLNMSDDPQQTYFSDGMTEDIITDLSKVSALSVLARTTSFALREPTLPAPDLAAQIGATHVLEGSVRKVDDHVRVTAQLVDGATGGHLWAERYDRPLRDIFALQDELTAAIVAALCVRLLPQELLAIEQRGTHDPEAYELYLLARRYHLSDVEDAGEVRQLQAVERLCRRAVTLDPDYARAWSLMAVAQSALNCIHGYPVDGGREAIERALALDPLQPEPHAIKARNLLREGDMEAAEAALNEALTLGPECGAAHAVAGRFFYVQRDFARAIPHLERATALDPTWAGEAGLLLSSYNALGDAEGMRAVAKKVLARAEKVLARDYVNLSSIGCGVGALIALGQADRAKALLQRGLLIDPDNLHMRYNFACGMSALLNDADAAIALLEPVFERISAGWLRHARVDPDLDPIREDARLVALFDAAERRLAAQG